MSPLWAVCRQVNLDAILVFQAIVWGKATNMCPRAEHIRAEGALQRPFPSRSGKMPWLHCLYYNGIFAGVFGGFYRDDTVKCFLEVHQDEQVILELAHAEDASLCLAA